MTFQSYQDGDGVARYPTDLYNIIRPWYLKTLDGGRVEVRPYKINVIYVSIISDACTHIPKLSIVVRET